MNKAQARAEVIRRNLGHTRGRKWVARRRWVRDGYKVRKQLPGGRLMYWLGELVRATP